MCHVRLFIVEKMGFGMAPSDGGFIPNLSHYYRKLAFFILLKPYLCTQDCAYVRMLWPMNAGFCSNTGAKSHFGLLFPKIDYCIFKK